MKNIKNGQKMFLIAQKKCPDALNATQKTPAFYKVRFLKKSRKNLKNDHFLVVLVKNGYFMRVFWIFFRNRTLHRAGFFCVAFSASQRFF